MGRTRALCRQSNLPRGSNCTSQNPSDRVVSCVSVNNNNRLQQRTAATTVSCNNSQLQQQQYLGPCSFTFRDPTLRWLSSACPLAFSETRSNLWARRKVIVLGSSSRVDQPLSITWILLGVRDSVSVGVSVTREGHVRCVNRAIFLEALVVHHKILVIESFSAPRSITAISCNDNQLQQQSAATTISSKQTTINDYNRRSLTHRRLQQDRLNLFNANPRRSFKPLLVKVERLREYQTWL